MNIIYTVYKGANDFVVYCNGGEVDTFPAELLLLLLLLLDINIFIFSCKCARHIGHFGNGFDNI